MSNIPGISPITPDIEDVRRSDEDGFFGDEGESTTPQEDIEDGGENGSQTEHERKERRLLHP